MTKKDRDEDIKKEKERCYNCNNLRFIRTVTECYEWCKLKQCNEIETIWVKPSWCPGWEKLDDWRKEKQGTNKMGGI